MIYLDHNATTPIDARVLEAMMPYLTGEFGNAASRQHAAGCRAAQAVESAREQVARLLGADPREVLFTSGATESDNLAILGTAGSEIHARDRRQVVTVLTEHPAVLDPCRELARRGFPVTLLEVDREGRIDLDQLEQAIGERTLLVSVMHGNNETGLLHPLEEIGRLTRTAGALFHTDATQTVGKEPLDLLRCNIDLLSLSAHKMYGPKGAGALYVRRRRPRVRLHPRQFGGGHERGLRSGTANVPAIVGLGAAAELAAARREQDRIDVGSLRDRLEGALLELDGVRRNGPASPRLSGTSNLSFAGIEAEELMKETRELAVSTASACTSAAIQPSHVLGAMGLDDERIRGSIRFSLGRGTTAAEIEQAIEMIRGALEDLRDRTNG